MAGSNGIYNYEVEPTEAKNVKLAGGKKLAEDHKAGEVVFLVEALLYRWLLSLSYPKSLLLSFCANALSFLLGLFLL